MTTFVYDAENRLSTRTLPNGVVTTYQYDVRDRPLSVVHRNAGGTVLASRTYVRAAGGEPTQITKEDGSYVLVGYDSALRITSERYFDEVGTLESEISYAYDADGNRVSKTVDGVVSSYAYQSGARITSAGSSTYGNDNAGRVTSMNRADGAFTLSYDSDDHVSQVVKNGLATTFGFDAMGRRTRVSSGGVDKRYLVAPNMGAGFESPQMVTDQSGAAVASFVFAGEHPLMKIENGVATYYLADSMGSVIGFADAAGAGLGTLEYDGFGNAHGGDALSVGTAGDFRFQGMWKDPSGLYYVRARVYEAETGRFTSRDPARGDAISPESLLPYGFANNAPLMFCDPTGLTTMEMLTAVAAMGVLGGIAYPALSAYLGRGSGFGAGFGVDWSAGVADAVTLGATSAIRKVLGINTVDEHSAGYKIGQFSPAFYGVAEGLFTGLMAATRYAASRVVANAGAHRFLKWGDDIGADAAYEAIRGSVDDVAAIASNTGISESWIARVKQHLFFNKHKLDGGVARFDSSPGIANAWRRLESGEYTANDLNLLRHELFEARFESIFGTNYRTAHEAAIRAGYKWLEEL